MYNSGANAQIGALGVILSQRPGNNSLRITALPHLQHSGAGGDPLTGDNPLTINVRARMMAGRRYLKFEVC